MFIIEPTASSIAWLRLNPTDENNSGTKLGSMKNKADTPIITSRMKNPSLPHLIVSRLFPIENRVIINIEIKNKNKIDPPFKIGVSETDDKIQLTTSTARKLTKITSKYFLVSMLPISAIL